MPRHVIIHAAVSLDGATAGFRPDVARFYEIATQWSEDVTLAGADTILAQEPALADTPRPGPAPDGPLLAVVDSRRRVSEWEALRDCGHWRDVAALRAAGRADGQGFPREIVTGGERVDLTAALAQLEGDIVRVDSGGALNGALLREGLVDEISLLVHPCIIGHEQSRWYGAATPASLEAIDAETLDGGLAWLRYRVVGGVATSDPQP